MWFISYYTVLWNPFLQSILTLVVLRRAYFGRMDADGLDPFVVKSSSAMVLAVLDKSVLFFRNKGLRQSVPFQIPKDQE